MASTQGEMKFYNKKNMPWPRKRNFQNKFKRFKV